MRFTRKIPGIRLPLPGRPCEEVDAFTPWPSAYVVACAYMYLMLCTLGIYLDCVLRLDGGMAVFWLEPQGFGISILGLVTATNVLLVALLVMNFWLSGRWRGRPGRKRVVGLLFTLGTIGGFQYWANNQAKFGEDMVAHILAKEALFQEKVEIIEREIESLGDHIWAGKYTGPGFGGELSCWFAPEAGFISLGRRAGSSDKDHPARRAYDSSCGEAELHHTGNGIQLMRRYGDRVFPGTEYTHEWVGDRHFLVRSDCYEIFQEQVEKGEIVGQPTLTMPQILRHDP